ncbi:MAG: acyltransferase family protein [Gammaproteobacteria bacterium]
MGESGGGRIPSLDGFRAISILMVLFGHLSGTRGFPLTLEAYKHGPGHLAHLGVLVFFVISGFLITSLLLSEREKTHTISLKRFYLRRVLRIFPAFYTLILALAVATLIGWIHLTGHDFAYALTYTANYYPNRSWQIGHLWSLSIEEQFYLLWPLTLLALRGRRALIVAIAAIFIGPLVRAGILEWTFHVNPHTALAGMSIFPEMFDYLATGCALALLRPWLLKQAWYLRLTGSRWLLLAVPLTLLINRLSGYTLVNLLGSPVLNVCIALLIESSTRHASSLAGRFLNWRPIAFLGVLSYSLYLWQQPFLDRHSDAWVNAFPQNLALAFVAALLSYFVVEHAFLGLRRRLKSTASLPAHTDSIPEDASNDAAPRPQSAGK